MISFKDMLTESKAGKNLHLEHIEDEILNFGVDGGRAAINFLRSLRDMLAGGSRSSVNMTVKWDGAPAIFAGIEPETGDFFVAKKSVFNVNPKLYKTEADIDDDLSGTLNSKFKVALAELSKLNIPTVTVTFGTATAGGAYQPGMSDYNIFVKDQADVALAGPPLVQMATGEISSREDIGGAKMHAEKSGLAEYLADNCLLYTSDAADD